MPHGGAPATGHPKTAGADFEFTPILKPLEPFRNRSRSSPQLCDPLDGHAVTVAGLAERQRRRSRPRPRTSAPAPRSIRSSRKQIGQDTVFPSLELATEDFTGYIGGCDPGYSCAYMNTLSWRTPTTPLPMEINPRVVFERMFGRPGTRGAAARADAADKSILDSIKDDVARPRRRPRTARPHAS